MTQTGVDVTGTKPFYVTVGRWIMRDGGIATITFCGTCIAIGSWPGGPISFWFVDSGRVSEISLSPRDLMVKVGNHE